MTPRYLIVGGDFFQASRVAANLDLSLRDWKFIFDQSFIVGAGTYAEPAVYELAPDAQ